MSDAKGIFCIFSKLINSQLINYPPGWYQSSQMDRAVNAVAYAFRGANPFQPTRVAN